MTGAAIMEEGGGAAAPDLSTRALRAKLERRKRELIEAELRDRPSLWTALERLAEPDPAARAKAAAEVAALAKSLGINWRRVLPMPWPAEVAALASDPRVTAAERCELAAIRRWGRPGKDGMAVVADIKARLAGQTSEIPTRTPTRAR